MKITRLNGLSLALVGLMFAVSAWFYGALPDPVPSHWNAAGQADDWVAKPWGAYLVPLISLGLLPLLLVLPAISPRGFRLDSARRVYDIVVFATMCFLLVVQLLSFRAALGHEYELARAMPVLLGLLFVVLGNYLDRFPRNFFIGIRTPWTLASETVWRHTHVAGGRVFIAGGLALIIAGVLGASAGWVAALIAVTALVPVLHSLLLYRKLHGFGEGEG